MTHGRASAIKAWTTKISRESISILRDLFGGNGILYDIGLGRVHADIEALYTYEGTYNINMLIAGKELTRQNAFFSKL